MLVVCVNDYKKRVAAISEKTSPQ